eukprot:2395677-Alexandrium_andersonii.AAC.1
MCIRDSFMGLWGSVDAGALCTLALVACAVPEPETAPTTSAAVASATAGDSWSALGAEACTGAPSLASSKGAEWGSVLAEAAEADGSPRATEAEGAESCLLYTSDAADDM